MTMVVRCSLLVAALATSPCLAFQTGSSRAGSRAARFAPLSAKVSTRERFDSMIDEITLPAATIEFIDSPKQRVLFKGAAAAVAAPAVREAFAIVYEDLGPVRVAGDLIFNSLAGVAETAKVTAGSEPRLQADAAEAAAAGSALSTSRKLFDLIDADASGSLDRAELARSPELVAIIRTEGEDDEAAVDRFMATADDNGDGVISFLEFAMAAATDPSLRLVDEALSAALAQQESLAADAAVDKAVSGWWATVGWVRSAAACGPTASQARPTSHSPLPNNARLILHTPHRRRRGGGSGASHRASGSTRCWPRASNGRKRWDVRPQ